MTSTTDTAGHPEVEEISDLTEGLLPPSRTADVRLHLDDCPLCADVYASLEEIRGMLGTLPGPPRMPDDVAGRIDAALAAEALLNATAPEPETTPQASRTVDTPRPASSEGDRAHVSRETSPAADRPIGHPRASTGPGRRNSKRRGRPTTVLAGILTAAALGLGTLLVQSINDDGSDKNPTDSQQQASDTFSGVKLEDRVADLLGEPKSKPDRDPLGSLNEPGSESATENNPTTKVVPDVPTCIAKGIGGVDGLIASEEGKYQGADAFLVVLPDRANDTRVIAYVVDSSCLGKASEPAGDVLLKRSYSRL